MYLKMKRIKLLLNYLGLLMNIHASIDRAFPVIFYLKIHCLLRKRRKKPHRSCFNTSGMGERIEEK